jgi:hypothetical protein
MSGLRTSLEKVGTGETARKAQTWRHRHGLDRTAGLRLAVVNEGPRQWADGVNRGSSGARSRLAGEVSLWSGGLGLGEHSGNCTIYSQKDTKRLLFEAADGR